MTKKGGKQVSSLATPPTLFVQKPGSQSVGTVMRASSVLLLFGTAVFGVHGGVVNDWNRSKTREVRQVWVFPDQLVRKLDIEKNHFKNLTELLFFY